MDSLENAYSSGFDRYWRHYAFMKRWTEKHRQIVKEIAEDTRCQCQQRVPSAQPFFQEQQSVFKIPAVPCARSSPANLNATFDTDSSSSVSSDTHAEKRTKAKRRKNKRKRKSSLATSDSSQGESEHFKVEFNDEYLEFMQKSAAHRQQREVVKSKENLERMEVDDKGILVDEKARMAAPAEQPGMRRTHEIKLLYGDRSLKIHGMETAQQLCFQQACDKLKPLHWPNIPLRISFT